MRDERTKVASQFDRKQRWQLGKVSCIYVAVFSICIDKQELGDKQSLLEQIFGQAKKQELTNLQLRHLGGEALHHGGVAPPVLVDGEHDEPQVTAGVEAGNEEHGLDVGDVGEHDLWHDINHLQHEDLVQTPVKPSLASENRKKTDKSY